MPYDDLTKKGKEKLADLELQYGIGGAEQMFEATYQDGDGTIKEN